MGLDPMLPVGIGAEASATATGCRGRAGSGPPPFPANCSCPPGLQSQHLGPGPKASPPAEHSFGPWNAAPLCHLLTPRPSALSTAIPREPAGRIQPCSEQQTKRQPPGERSKSREHTAPPGPAAKDPTSQRLRAPALLLPKNQDS